MAHSDAPPQDGRASLSAQSGNGAIITPMRRFPPSWTIEEHKEACFVVRDATGQALGYFYRWVDAVYFSIYPATKASN